MKKKDYFCAQLIIHQQKHNRLSIKAFDNDLGTCAIYAKMSKKHVLESKKEN